jgi:hypothetical protein
MTRGNPGHTGHTHTDEARAKIKAGNLKHWGEPEHGTHRMYKNHGCRCQACKTAWAKYRTPYRKRRKEAGL